MNDTERLQLRREACEALGWWKDPYGEWWHHPNCNSLALSKCNYPAHKATEDLPALESDNGLALDALVKWADSKEPKLQWQLHRVDGTYNCFIEMPNIDDWPDEDGETPAICICKAICASAEKEGSE